MPHEDSEGRVINVVSQYYAGKQLHDVRATKEVVTQSIEQKSFKLVIRFSEGRVTNAALYYIQDIKTHTKYDSIDH